MKRSRIRSGADLSFVLIQSLGTSVVAVALALTGCVVHAGGEIATQGGGGMEVDVDRPGSDFTSFDLSTASPETCRDACASDGRCAAYTFVRPGVQGPNARCWLKNGIPAAVSSNCCISGVKSYAAGPSPAPPPPPPAPPAAPPPPAFQAAPPNAMVAPPVRGVAPPPPPPPPSSGALVAPPVRGVAAQPPAGHDDHGWRGDDRRDHDNFHRRDGALEQNVDRPGRDFKSFDLPRADPDLCQRACWETQGCRAFTFVRPGVQGPNARCWLKNEVPPATPSGCCVSGVR